MKDQNGRHPLILFDGVCNLCNGAVKFIIPRDPQGLFHFASLQSDFGQALLSKHNIEGQPLDSLILLDHHHMYLKSDAVLRIARELSKPWPLFSGFRLIPRPLRDGLYDLVARHRYRVFGKKDTCMIPAKGIRDRFEG